MGRMLRIAGVLLEGGAQLISEVIRARQLDYLLLSAGLAKANAGKPMVMRLGLPWRAQQVGDTRLDGVGENEPKASDHAPLYMDITLV